VSKFAAPTREFIMSKHRKTYDWAQAMFSLAASQSSDINELAASADLDPTAGDLSDVDLSDLDLSGQNLSGWDLSHANLENTILKGTELRGAKVDPWALVTAQDWELAELDDELREVAQGLNPAIRRSIDGLEWSKRPRTYFRENEIRLIGDLVQKSEAELMRFPNFSRKSLNEVKETLARLGLHLGMELQGWRS
jgi:hypothetical protein